MAELYVPLDVNAQDDPKIIAAGDMGELVFYRSLQLAKRLQSDGFIARGQLKRLGCSPKLAVTLVSVGLWDDAANGFMIPSFLKRNPSRETVDEQRRAETDRKAKWRRDKTVTRDNPPRDGGTRPSRDAGHDVYATRSEGELDLDSESETSSSHLEPGCGQPSDDEKLAVPHQLDPVGRQVREILERCADVRMEGKTVSNRAAYRRRVIDDLTTEHAATLRRLIPIHPGAPIQSFAGHVLGEANSLHIYRVANAPTLDRAQEAS